MEFTTNIGFVIQEFNQLLLEVENPETISRSVALALLPEMRKRIHVDGKKSDGSKIGEYSNSYLKTRQRFNRGPSKEVVASLTRQLENSYTLAADGDGYTIGVSTPESEEKIFRLEERYGNIYGLTEGEKEIAKIVAADTFTELLK